MRFKILSLFAAIQIISFGLWSTFSHAESQPGQLPNPPQIHSAPSKPSVPVLLPDFAVRNMEQKSRFLNSIKINQITTVLKKLPQTHAEAVKNIILDYSPDVHRGMGGNSMIILRAVNMDTEEMIGVFVHELGHNVDYAALLPDDESNKSTFTDGQLALYESDPSVAFYKISWVSNVEHKEGTERTDFVSGYASSDPFEDFAECYVYYILHNRDFKALAAASEALYAKYRFMKYEVFDGKEFDTGDGQVDKETRPWDITVLDYDLNSFMS